MFGYICYYFEAQKMNFTDAQKSCDSKFGSSGGYLAEPQTTERSIELNRYAKESSNLNLHWIGYDNLGRNATDFRYSFSGGFSMIQGLSFSGLNASDASTSYDENCVAFVNSNMTSHAGYIDDRQCKSQYSFICEMKSGNVSYSFINFFWYLAHYILICIKNRKKNKSEKSSNLFFRPLQQRFLK